MCLFVEWPPSVNMEDRVLWLLCLLCRTGCCEQSDTRMWKCIVGQLATIVSFSRSFVFEKERICLTIRFQQITSLQEFFGLLPLGVFSLGARERTGWRELRSHREFLNHCHELIRCDHSIARFGTLTPMVRNMHFRVESIT